MPRELLPQAFTAKVYMEVGVVHQAHPLTTRHGPNWVGGKILSKKNKLSPLLELALKLTQIKGFWWCESEYENSLVKKRWSPCTTVG